MCCLTHLVLNFESGFPQPAFDKEMKKHTLDRLAWSDMFETFLANKWVGDEHACCTHIYEPLHVDVW